MPVPSPRSGSRALGVKETFTVDVFKFVPTVYASKQISNCNCVLLRNAKIAKEKKICFFCFRFAVTTYSIIFLYLLLVEPAPQHKLYSATATVPVPISGRIGTVSSSYIRYLTVYRLLIRDQIIWLSLIKN